jgi:hypothetical protein
MKIIQKWQSGHANAYAVMSLALARYNFSTPEIRVLMRHVLGYAISGRTIKRLVRSSGRHTKRGRPRSTPRIHKGDVDDLVAITAKGIDPLDGNVLQLLQEIQTQFGLTPQQYLKWVARFVRRGKFMMRKCLLCDRFFPSQDSGERHCRACQGGRRRLLNEERQSSFDFQ